MSLQWTPEYREKVLSGIPLRRLGRADDIADLAVFLASDMAGFITGESININGGNYMN
jgi:3-oxoacyl-[acyl-carrier protein] reductase